MNCLKMYKNITNLQKCAKLFKHVHLRKGVTLPVAPLGGLPTPPGYPAGLPVRAIITRLSPGGFPYLYVFLHRFHMFLYMFVCYSLRNCVCIFDMK